jgi:hypothetical protein
MILLTFRHGGEERSADSGTGNRNIVDGPFAGISVPLNGQSVRPSADKREKETVHTRLRNDLPFRSIFSAYTSLMDNGELMITLVKLKEESSLMPGCLPMPINICLNSSWTFLVQRITRLKAGGVGR